jgi:hypothetical protein
VAHQQLACQPGLPKPGFAKQQDEAKLAPSRACKLILKRLKLRAPPNQRDTPARARPSLFCRSTIRPHRHTAARWSRRARASVRRRAHSRTRFSRHSTANANRDGPSLKHLAAQSSRPQPVPI